MLCEIRLNATERTTTNRGTAHSTQSRKAEQDRTPGEQKKTRAQIDGSPRANWNPLSTRQESEQRVTRTKPQFHTTSCFEKCQGCVCLRTITPRSAPRRIPGMCAWSSNHFRRCDLEIVHYQCARGTLASDCKYGRSHR